MSTYSRQTKHPVTGEWHEATWIDDFYGRHRYGVQFPDGGTYNPEKTKLETRDDEPMTYTEKKCCEHYNGKKDITNSCIFCKTYIPRNTEKRLEEFGEKFGSDLDYIYQIKDVKSFLTESINQAVAEERERVVKEIEKYMSYCVELQNKAIANGNAITVETWGDRWVGAKRILSSLDNPLTDKE